MTTCGYICPQCEGRSFTEEGNPCDWCSETRSQTNPVMLSNEEWQRSVHEGNCCGHWEEGSIQQEQPQGQ